MTETRTDRPNAMDRIRDASPSALAALVTSVAPFVAARRARRDEHTASP